MDKYKTYTTLLSIVSIILLLLLIFGGKKIVYVCYDGTEQQVASKCPAVPSLTITEKEAKDAMIDYASSFARSRPGVVASVIGEVSRVNSSWLAYVTFSNSKTNEFSELTFSIDGKTSLITCIEGCEYLRKSEMENATVNN
jgi:hypothetical protein